ncbi:hypothetical protein Tco_0734991 [Tanacetum coccineum]
MHYLNITMRNVVKVFHKDSVPGNGSGVSGSGMLDEEEIIKLLKEEEMADLELQVCGNVIDRKNQYMLDEEALNLAFKEEARAEYEWLEECSLTLESQTANAFWHEHLNGNAIK